MVTAFSNFSFLNPGAGLAFLALLIPILIHLFNRSPGLRVVVGSIELIKRAKARRVTEIKLMQYILLLIRLIIFSLLALILMGLASRAFFDVADNTAYVSPAWIAAASTDEIAALQNEHAGSDIFLLDDELSPLTEAAIEAIKSDSTLSQLTGQSGAILLAALTEQKHGANTHVYITDLSGEYAGEAPGDWPLVWHVRESARESAQQSAKPPAAPKLPLALTVFSSPASLADAALIERAVLALNRHRNVDIRLKPVSSDAATASDTEGADWGIWLSSDPLPEVLLSGARSTRFISLGAARPTGLTRGWADIYPFTQIETRRLAPSAAGDEILWMTDAGQPLLSRSVNSGSEVYHLLTSLEGSTLGTAPGFADLLLELLTSPSGFDRGFRHAPVIIARNGAAESPTFTYPQVPRTNWLVLMLVIFWVLERWLSERVGRDA